MKINMFRTSKKCVIGRQNIELQKRCSFANEAKGV